ncbi:hypothetical protein PFICI_13936 [Pestalotiopsis fici W106-1]|uniref:2-oxoadipate dioxygenase/decarboxylase n=1 Tax=Pestalotiopsis fici (strain W106-1 / CGMCC3.15140) TaxID=1229662 RepID=W3WJG1_PESFW|nr:uncharacterized protein PFICI_13936 [Pestalotiopsis fici W106-1]ETS74070.1 hypothetical protein PFICI_13936 [Pestalotiopsis fici W106-1]
MTSSVLPSRQLSAFGSTATMANEALFVHPDDLRTAFATAMSHMYKEEVPLYGDLVQIVSDVNREVISQNSIEPPTADRLERLMLERHGAIRLGTPEELGTVRRIFALMGMQPVGYYDLSVAGLPMHATCFRPICESSLARNPFRIFTTLLRPELVQSDAARDLALRLLSERNIFSQQLMQMLKVAEHQDHRLDCQQGEVFIREALRTFCWAPVAAATRTEYEILKNEHPILADIACFQTCHINHLTPRTLDIGRAQRAMQEQHMVVKERIEGPPSRRFPILLRQTSFIALEERIQFRAGDGAAAAADLINGSHKARFGEIEERGTAVTPAGRALYDKLLGEALDSAQHLSPEGVDAMVVEKFRSYPDTWDELRKGGLVYFKYRCITKSRHHLVNVANIPLGLGEGKDLERLIDAGVVETVPITYEDFLPFSAAGIFQSNLRHGSRTNQEPLQSRPDLDALEAALGRSVVDADELYAAAQQGSLQSCLEMLRSVLSPP